MKIYNTKNIYSKSYRNVKEILRKVNLSIKNQLFTYMKKTYFR